MKTICFLNVKGGVGKTTSAINFAHILATVHKKRVIVIDIDKQANTTKFFKRYDINHLSVSELLTEKGIDVKNVIVRTDYDNIDLIPADMRLLNANKVVLIDSTRPQHDRLEKHINTIADEYDFCIIDCPTDFNISTYNVLNIKNQDVLVPIKIDEYSFEGLSDVISAISEIQTNFNSTLNLQGAFITMYRQGTNLNRIGKEYIEKILPGKVFKTYIRDTVKVTETATVKMPLIEYAPSCTAAKDYLSLVNEYLEQ